MKSINIWKDRPNESGSGSRGNLASFKIDYINKFIKDNEINYINDVITLVDFKTKINNSII